MSLDFVAYISSNEHTPAFDQACSSTPGRAMGILKRRYPRDWKDLCLWADVVRVFPELTKETPDEH
jgi:hypothetical protein